MTAKVEQPFQPSIEGERKDKRPGPRGWPGRGGGRVGYVEAPPEYRGTTVQVCGLWPFIAGSGTPMVGVPLGYSTGHQTVCSDPLSWFSRAKLISNPSVLILGIPGLGKSSLAARMAVGLAGYGHLPLVFGDLRPDYADLILALGGNVVKLGRGQGTLNILDPGRAAAAARRLTGTGRRQLLADAAGRRLNMVSALIGLNRQGLVTDQEEAILAAALEVLDKHHRPGNGILPHLIDVLEAKPPEVMAITLDRGEEKYRAAVDPLQISLQALCRGAMGDTFAHKTSVPISLDAPLSIDISGIDQADSKLQAAVLLAAWSEGFGAIAATQALADAALEPQRHFFVVLDELWRVIRAGRGMVDRIDALTRLNRSTGVGMAMITHSLADLISLPDAADRAKARGFAERAGYLICGGLPAGEMSALREVVGMSDAEQRMVTSWSTPASWDPEAGMEGDPPGRGQFLLKVGGRPGVPVKVVLTAAELAVSDTNRRWRA